jgi:MFS family permease
MSHDFGRIIRSPAFHVLFWSYLICGFTTTGVIETHLLPYAAWCGFPPIQSAAAYGLLSLVNFGGMIFAGWLTDRVHRPMLLGVIYLLRALTFIVLGALPGTSVEMLFAFAVLFGVVDYATIPVTASLVASHVGIKVMGLAMGMISAGHSVGGALGAYLGGFVFDSTGDYATLWLMSVWLAAGAGLMAFLLKAQPPLRAYRV